MKVSFDVTSLDDSPLQIRASDILVGDDGVLFRTQFQAEFWSRFSLREFESPPARKTNRRRTE